MSTRMRAISRSAAPAEPTTAPAAAPAEETPQAQAARLQQESDDAVLAATGVPVSRGEEIPDGSEPPPTVAPGMLLIQMHGGGYQREVTQAEWENLIGKQTGRWDIVGTGLVADGHSAIENIA